MVQYIETKELSHLLVNLLILILAKLLTSHKNQELYLVLIYNN
jgi:hypothetical protein